MKYLYIFSDGECQNYAELVAKELGVDYQRANFEPLSVAGYDQVIVQNPMGFRPALHELRLYIRPPMTAVCWERVSGEHEKNNYGKELAEVADLFEEILFSCDEDVEWGRARGWNCRNAGVGWIASSCRRDVPWEQKQDKIFFCGHIIPWWGGDLLKRIESVKFCEEQNILMRSVSHDPVVNADLMASCKVALCPEGHAGYQSFREMEAAHAGTLILGYEGSCESRWPFTDSASVRLCTFDQFKEFVLSKAWNDPLKCVALWKINGARKIVANYRPEVVWKRILNVAD